MLPENLKSICLSSDVTRNTSARIRFMWALLKLKGIDFNDACVKSWWPLEKYFCLRESARDKRSPTFESMDRVGQIFFWFGNLEKLCFAISLHSNWKSWQVSLFKMAGWLLAEIDCDYISMRCSHSLLQYHSTVGPWHRMILSHAQIRECILIRVYRKTVTVRCTHSLLHYHPPHLIVIHDTFLI